MCFDFVIVSSWAYFVGLLGDVPHFSFPVADVVREDNHPAEDAQRSGQTGSESLAGETCLEPSFGRLFTELVSQVCTLSGI